MNNIKFGDIWVLGNHKVMCGDSTDSDMVKELIGGKTVKTIFTSPPYNMNKGLYDKYKDNLSSEKYIGFNMEVVNVWTEYLKGFLFWNISYNKNSRWEFIEIMYRIIKETELKFLELIVWDKVTPIPIRSNRFLTRRYENILVCGKDMDMIMLGTNLNMNEYFYNMKPCEFTNYWQIVPRNIQKKNHLACFPIELPTRAISLTTDEGDIVADPFLGSGTTLLACEEMGRVCYGMEINPVYVQDTIDQWENITGKRALKISNGMVSNF